MSLAAEKLLFFKKELLNRRAAIEGLVTQTSQLIAREEEVPADAVDMASNTEERILNLQLKGRDQIELAKIDMVLRRIESGHFGDCESCGEQIAEARLKANPMATLCIDCKAALEFEERGHARD